MKCSFMGNAQFKSRFLDNRVLSLKIKLHWRIEVSSLFPEKRRALRSFFFSLCCTLNFLWLTAFLHNENPTAVRSGSGLRHGIIIADTIISSFWFSYQVFPAISEFWYSETENYELKCSGQCNGYQENSFDYLCIWYGRYHGIYRYIKNDRRSQHVKHLLGDTTIAFSEKNCLNPILRKSDRKRMKPRSQENEV